MGKIFTQKDAEKRLEKKFPGITQGIQKEFTSLQIAYKIFELRRRKRLTQTELARRAGLKQSNLARMEQSGYSDYKISTLSKIAKAAHTRLQVSFA